MFARRLISLQKFAKYPVNPVFKRLMSEHGHGGVAGENLPFGKCIGNPGRLTFFFALFFGSASMVPCIAFIYMMHK